MSDRYFDNGVKRKELDHRSIKYMHYSCKFFES